jgi:hypothetical protein
VAIIASGVWVRVGYSVGLNNLKIEYMRPRFFSIGLVEVLGNVGLWRFLRFYEFLKRTFGNPVFFPYHNALQGSVVTHFSDRSRVNTHHISYLFRSIVALRHTYVYICVRDNTDVRTDSSHCERVRTSCGTPFDTVICQPEDSPRLNNGDQPIAILPGPSVRRKEASTESPLALAALSAENLFPLSLSFTDENTMPVSTSRTHYVDQIQEPYYARYSQSTNKK